MRRHFRSAGIAGALCAGLLLAGCQTTGIGTTTGGTTTPATSTINQVIAIAKTTCGFAPLVDTVVALFGSGLDISGAVGAVCGVVQSIPSGTARTFRMARVPGKRGRLAASVPIVDVGAYNGIRIQGTYKAR